MDSKVAEALRAYGAAAGFLEAERVQWLARLTPEEARAACEQLYGVWEQGGRRAGGDWKALDQLQIEDLLAIRRAFERLARVHGLL